MPQDYDEQASSNYRVPSVQTPEDVDPRACVVTLQYCSQYTLGHTAFSSLEDCPLSSVDAFFVVARWVKLHGFCGHCG